MDMSNILGQNLPAQAQLQLLLEGNQRFASGQTLNPHRDGLRRTEIARQQNPSALVISCSDSRQVPELIFDCGLGDLFVVHTAGHCVGASVMGTIEFGMLVLGIRLVMVLGHTRCGAIASALAARHEEEAPRGHLPALLTMIRPAVDDISMSSVHPDQLAEETMLQHVRRSVALIEESAEWEQRPLVVGGRYDLDTGLVTLVE